MFKVLNLLLLVVLALSGCSGDRCIDADDFGFSTFTISSRYDSSQLSEQQQQGNQVAPWLDSQFLVNGRPLLVMVKTWEYGVDRNNSSELSAWCAWFGDVTNTATLSTFCQKLQPCTFIDGKMCANTKDAQINNAPCLFKNGVGLYGLIAERGTDPNQTFITEHSPSGLTFHLGEPVVGYQLLDISKTGQPRQAGGLVYNYSDQGADSSSVKIQYADAKLYFKILDKYYDDNNGQYKIVIKSGIEDSRPDPLQFLTDLVKDNLFGTSGNDYGLIRNMYLKVTANPSYQIAVRGLLTLFVIFTALAFLSGNLELTHTELITRIIKIGIVSTLLSSQSSWTFFNDYLFVYFVGGVQQILQMLQSAVQTGSGSSSIIMLMIAPQTMAKLFSLLFVDWLGFIYIILFLIALYFMFMMIFEATIVYLTALIAIGMIIIMGPIFICFMLFQITRSLFENWLKQLISYVMQPLILFAGIAFISLIVRTEIYGSLGFRVCKHDFPYLGPLGELFGDVTDALSDAIGLDVSMGDSIFYWWFPVPMRAQDFTKTEAVIPVPIDYIKDDGTLCEAYGCFEERYIELPYLDPVKDIDRLNNFFSGKFVQLDGLLIIFVAVYLLSKFNEMSVSVASFLASTSGNLTSLRSAGHQSFAPIKGQLDRPFTALERQATGLKNRIGNKIGGAYEALMMESLRKDALGSGANKAVVDEVKRKYGMEQKDVKANAVKDYQQAIKAKLEAKHPSMGKQEIETKAADLAHKDYKELIKEFGRDGVDLNLKDLASEAKFARDYQNAYAQVHQDMSARGIGFFGKNISGLRAIEELNNQIKAFKEAKAVSRAGAVERAYASLEEKVTKTMNHEDFRLRTYGESLADSERAEQEKALNAKINRETIRAREDVLRPEFMAGLEARGMTNEANYFRKLAEEKLSHDIYAALTSGENPALMGTTFMKTKATDTQLRGLVDRTYEVRKEFLENDNYLRREGRYEVMHDKAFNDIKEKHDMLKVHYQRDIKPEEMSTLLTKYYNEQVSVNTDEARKSTSQFNQSLQDYEQSKKVLEKIDERKAYIDREINKQIDELNRHRVSSQTPEYKLARNEPSTTRKLRTIDDRLKRPQAN